MERWTVSYSSGNTNLSRAFETNFGEYNESPETSRLVVLNLRKFADFPDLIHPIAESVRVFPNKHIECDQE